ncbi:hypothetical protein CXG81DRAFT_13775 [Caulochytrium protostelioides]|uniref:WD40 repeat-like protein n=1 Tax=Caulochytrium protostelioides TaxID=1555241 RepID=A0A4P9X4J2_9FUNG|nr:WD40 repeat-like protein [Caulochytrium protostelioides]RKO99974.1 hypothetical protein CXG81DRAFT_13775 [Caulochytrium protostelioides]|eukprot:RKO99974.1 hypothetical protein CXG81DRAFT_13775 [Caulochytrium protostelioides]
MKVKTISRSDMDYCRERKTDIYKVQRNLDPKLHPFEKAREYARALTSVKMDRMFAKPFLAALDGHGDGVYALAKHPTHIGSVASGDALGCVKVWSLTNRDCRWTVQAHKGFAKGVCFLPSLASETSSEKFISVGIDRMIKLWSVGTTTPVASFMASDALNAVDYHYHEPKFITAGTDVQVWEPERSEPLHTLRWGSETITALRWNKTETSLFGACGSDRTITLYDLRAQSPISKTVMALHANAICWNPMEALNFTVASEDHNLYTFDMRRMNKAQNILKDHVSAVMDLDYSPTGTEIVSGGFDKTIRVFEARAQRSRDVYHTKRMQRVWCTRWSNDNQYLISGSDEGNLRVWKAQASAPIGITSTRQKQAMQYAGALKKKYGHLDEIKRIDKQRRVPSMISNTAEKKQVMEQARKRRDRHVVEHSTSKAKRATIKVVPERTKNVLHTE